MHSVGNAVQEVHDAEEDHEGPAGQLHIEGQVNDHGSGEDADDQPGLEFAPSAAGALDDIAHDGVVQRVKNTGGDHDRRDRAQLRRVQLLCIENKSQQIARDQIVDHIAAYGAQGEEPEILFCYSFFVHVIISREYISTCLSLRQAERRKDSAHFCRIQQDERGEARLFLGILRS